MSIKFKDQVHSFQHRCTAKILAIGWRDDGVAVWTDRFKGVAKIKAKVTFGHIPASLYLASPRARFTAGLENVCLKTVKPSVIWSSMAQSGKRIERIGQS
jgi:hypothetical protein